VQQPQTLATKAPGASLPLDAIVEKRDVKSAQGGSVSKKKFKPKGLNERGGKRQEGAEAKGRQGAAIDKPGQAYQL
jgi:hypothetical protein